MAAVKTPSTVEAVELYWKEIKNTEPLSRSQEFDLFTRTRAGDEAARQQIGAAVKAGGVGHRELIVRVNGLAPPWGRDGLTAACGFALDAILLPKVENADTVHQAEEVMDGAGAPPGMSIWCMMETPLAMLHAGVAAVFRFEGRVQRRLAGEILFGVR